MTEKTQKTAGRSKQLMSRGGQSIAVIMPVGLADQNTWNHFNIEFYSMLNSVCVYVSHTLCITASGRPV